MNHVKTNGEGLPAFLLRLRQLGVTDPVVLKIVESTPHDQFVQPEYHDHAWGSESLPMPCGQTLPPADVTVRLVAALGVEPSHSVLEIGTGSGFQTALLGRLAKRVQSTDRYATLIADAKARLERLGIVNVRFSREDGNRVTGAPDLYERIICDMAYDSQPRHLLERLASGGVAVTAIGPAQGEQMAVKLTKIGSRFEREDLFAVRLGVPERGVAEHL